jgi:hypothetical protein
MEGLRLTSVGAKIGLATATLANRLLGGLRFDVHLLGPMAMAATALLLVGASTLASLPARRAARVGPMAPLRAD